jgi:CubicO group peptidase (beta-lactamase class C family)
MTRLHIPGASVAVIHHGKLEWAKGYGVTKSGGAPITPETIFQAGSISKPITALAVLRLVQQGRLSLDTDVNGYLRSWKVPSSELTRNSPVTVRGLLSHTAGISVGGFNGYSPGAAVPTLHEVLDGAKPANSPPIRVNTVPGSVWVYSGGGYTILQQLLMDVTGRPFPAVLQDLVLTPLGMNHSTFDQPLPQTLRASAAAPHDGDGNVIAGGTHTYPELAAAGLWTTPTDLARYITAIQHARAGASGSVLSVTMATKMLTPVLADYGLGLELGADSAHGYFTKGGDTHGFVGYIVAYDTRGDGAVVLTNGDQGVELTREIVRSIAAVYDWPDFRSAQLSPVALSDAKRKEILGTYDIGHYGTFSIAERPDRQMMLLFPGSAPEPLVARSSNEFIELTDGTEIQFNKHTDGKLSDGAMIFERLRIPFSRVKQK